jgi:hypothetical protein
VKNNYKVKLVTFGDNLEFKTANIFSEVGSNTYPELGSYLGEFSKASIESFDKLTQKIKNFTFDKTLSQDDMPYVDLGNDHYLYGVSGNENMLQFMNENYGDPPVELISKEDLLDILNQWRDIISIRE